MSAPLAGVLVADFSRVLAGPLAAATLADLGATVVKVERPGRGDDTREWGPPWTGNSSSYFEAANRGKKSVQLDLDDPSDRVLATELARRADVVIENFKDGALDRRGLGYEAVRAGNPRVVYLSISGFGAGAGRDLGGYDFIVQAVGGLMSITGEPGSPTKVGVALVDVLTAKDAVIGVLAALRERAEAGVGQLVRVNLLSSLLGALANQASAFHATGRSPSPMGNAHPSIAPYETLNAADGMLAVAVGNDGQWRRFVETLGRPHLATDPRFRDNRLRVEHRDELVAAVEEALASDGVDAWIRRLSEARVPVGRVGTVADGFALAEELGLDPVVRFDGDATPQTRNPITFDRTPITDYEPPPQLGEHDAEIRAWLTDDRRRHEHPTRNGIPARSARDRPVADR